MKWFTKSPRSLPTTPTEYPLGTFVKSESGYFYIVSEAKRYRIVSERCLASWRPPRVVQTSDVALSRYRIVKKMAFRNGSLIWNISDGKIYLIESGKRRHITSPDALDRLGAVHKEVMAVSLDEVNMHPEGEALS